MDLDRDHKKHGYFPNIAQMKISAYHKQQGDQVEWYTPFDHYDKVYISKVFSTTPDYQLPINADEVVRGGSGYAIHIQNGREVYGIDHPLPTEIEHTCPDYSLYGITDTAYGFLSRGCPRGCAFCHVAAKEGTRAHKVADLTEFWNGQKHIVLCDPNILACKEWDNLLTQLAESKAWVDLNQGIDVRLMTKEKAQALSLIKMKEVHFAWDKYQDRDIVLRGLELYKKYNRINEHNSIVFTIVNFDTTLEQDLDRIYTLRDLGYWPYIMVYDKSHADKIYTKLQRWVNNRFIFPSCKTFDEYLRNN